MLLTLPIFSQLAGAAAPIPHSFVGIRAECPSTCHLPCSRGLGGCSERALVVSSFSAGNATRTAGPAVALHNVAGPTRRDALLDAREYAAADASSGDYFLLRQPVKQTGDGVPAAAAPQLFRAGRGGAVELALVNASDTTAAVMPLEALHVDTPPTGEPRQLVAVGVAGEVVVITDVDGAGPARARFLRRLWSPPALFTRGVSAFDPDSRTLFAMAQLPAHGGSNDAVCGSTHGKSSCPTDFFSLRVGEARAEPRNRSRMLYCFDGSNAQLSCSGTNIQHLAFHKGKQQLLGLTRSGKYGPSVSLLNISGPAVGIDTFWSDLRSTYEFVSDGSYFRGVVAPNPAAYHADSQTLFTLLRSGSHLKFLGVRYPAGLVVDDEATPDLVKPEALGHIAAL